MSDIPIRPFADDFMVYGDDGIAIENGLDEVKIDVRRSFGRNKRDLASLKALQGFLAELTREIEATPSLPEEGVASPTDVVLVDNPFG